MPEHGQHGRSLYHFPYLWNINANLQDEHQWFFERDWRSRKPIAVDHTTLELPFEGFCEQMQIDGVYTLVPYLVPYLEGHWHGWVVFCSSHVNFCLVQEATQWQGSHRYPSVRLLPRMVHFPGSELMARWFHGVMSATGETVVQLNLTFESGTSYRLKLKRALVVERVDQFEIWVMYVLQQLNQNLVFVLICEWVLGNS